MKNCMFSLVGSCPEMKEKKEPQDWKVTFEKSGADSDSATEESDLVFAPVLTFDLLSVAEAVSV